ncbi:hypothetical protein MLD52_14555 [Puniceicoccaceae bacterium K14]|nr:hypothetical protein [Puniceicoccaceae bacterium K14]
MNIKLIPLLILTVAASIASKAAEPKTWEVKLRAAYLQTVDHSDAFSALGIDFARDSVVVEDKLIPEIDIAYAFTKNIVAELVLTIPQTHDVSLNGVGSLGTLEHLPPTLSLVYEFDKFAGLTPYISGGLNFTWITDKDLSVAGVELDLEDYSLGAAIGTGVTYDLNEKWKLDASVKWIDLESDVTAGGVVLTNAQLDPFLFSFGANFSF